MGLGKTPQAVMALPGAPWGELDPAVIIVCPAGLRTVWSRHLERWRPDLRPVIIKDTKSIRPPVDGEVVIVSPDALGWAAPKKRGATTTPAQEAASSALARLRLGSLAHGNRLVWILDEAHRLKGGKTKRAEVVGQLIRPSVKQGAAVWALTATPTPRDPSDLWCLLYRMGADAHPGIFRGVGQAGWAAWCGARRVSRERWDYSAVPVCPLDDPAAAGSILLRRLVCETLQEIPPPTHSIRLVHLGGSLRSIADELLKTACRSIGADHKRIARADIDGPDEVDEALMREMSARRGDLSKISAAIAEAKVPTVMAELDRLIEEGEPTIVYSEHVAAIDEMKRRGHPVVKGGMGQRAKDKAVDAFQEGDALAFGFTGAGREGITVTRASHMIEADTNWSADDRDQALGRAHRFDRVGAVSVIHVLADHPIERLKMRVLGRKRSFKIAALGSSL